MMKYEFAKNEHLFFPWSFLFFRALLLNKDYEDYCINNKANGNTDVVADLVTKYQDIDKFYEFWGNIYDYEDIFSLDNLIENRFLCWCALHGHKLLGLSFNSIKIVPAGQNLSPQQGDIYFTVADDWDLHEYQNLYSSSLRKIFEFVKKEPSKFPPNRLNGVGNDLSGSLLITEKRLDAYEWKFRDRLSGPQCLKEAYKSEKKCWAGLKGRVDDVALSIAAQTTPSFDEIPKNKLKAHRDDIAVFATDGVQVIKNILKGNFPDP